MYGANYSTNVTKNGDQAQFQFALTVPNGRYLADQPDLLSAGFDFLNEVINHPLLQPGLPAFDSITFARQQHNLAVALRAVDEDKALAARLAAQRLHFGEVVAGYPSAGRLSDVARLTVSEVFDVYQQMVTDDEVHIYVLGDVAEANVKAAAAKLQLADRKPATSGLFYHNKPAASVKSVVKHESLTQAKLDLIYHFPVDYGQALYYPAQVFNGLFGGTPLSLLFTNVREKHSLAYYANSSVNFFNQTLTVQTGIDGQQAEQVQTIIAEQLADLTEGRFSDQRFHQVQETLINAREAAQDSPRVVIGSQLLDDLSGQTISVADWVNGINAVTPADVTMVARLATLATVYLLTN